MVTWWTTTLISASAAFLKFENHENITKEYVQEMPTKKKYIYEPVFKFPDKTFI